MKITGTATTIAGGGARADHRLTDRLAPADVARVRADANAWIKRLRLVEYGGRTMRQAFTFRGDALWWFTEIYLHKTRVFERALATVLALEHLVDEAAPTRLEVHSPDSVVRRSAAAFAEARGLPVTIGGEGDADHRSARRLGFAVGPAAWLSRLRGAANRPAVRPQVAAFVHNAFWRESGDPAGGGRESYIGAVLDEISRQAGAEQVALVGVGPRRNFRSRRWWDPFVGEHSARRVTPIERYAPRAALGESLALWSNRQALADALVAGDSVRAAARWGALDLWSVVEPALRQVAIVQWPWSARSMDEARACLATLEPSAIVTYAEAGGWGRALMLEARRAGVPSVGVQHGFIYRHWLNYEHEADEMADEGGDGGFPRPDRTLVFDGYAVDTLVTRGHFPVSAIAITGSPRLDELARQVDLDPGARAELRSRLNLRTTDRLVLVASKFTEIHTDLGSVVAAIEALPDVRAVIAPHPAEPRTIYASVIAGSPHTAVAPNGVELGSLLAIADAIVTKNSTAAIDAMTLSVPAIVVGLPTNLGPFVEAGAMVGGPAADLRAILEAVLYDQDARAGVVLRGQTFARRYRMASDGQAAQRAAEAVLGAGNRPESQRGGEDS